MIVVLIFLSHDLFIIVKIVCVSGFGILLKYFLTKIMDIKSP